MQALGAIHLSLFSYCCLLYWSKTKKFGPESNRKLINNNGSGRVHISLSVQCSLMYSTDMIKISELRLMIPHHQTSTS